MVLFKPKKYACLDKIKEGVSNGFKLSGAGIFESNGITSKTVSLTGQR
jgi:hypothetical protein